MAIYGSSCNSFLFFLSFDECMKICHFLHLVNSTTNTTCKPYITPMTTLIKSFLKRDPNPISWYVSGGVPLVVAMAFRISMPHSNHAGKP